MEYTERKLTKKSLIHAGMHQFPMMNYWRDNFVTPSSCPSSEKNECFYVGVPNFNDNGTDPR